jgi:hypothetical protein
MLGAHVKLSIKIEIWIASRIEIIVFWLPSPQAYRPDLLGGHGDEYGMARIHTWSLASGRRSRCSGDIRAVTFSRE